MSQKTSTARSTATAAYPNAASRGHASIPPGTNLADVESAAQVRTTERGSQTDLIGPSKEARLWPTNQSVVSVASRGDKKTKKVAKRGVELACCITRLQRPDELQEIVPSANRVSHLLVLETCTCPNHLRGKQHKLEISASTAPSPSQNSANPEETIPSERQAFLTRGIRRRSSAPRGLAAGLLRWTGASTAHLEPERINGVTRYHTKKRS